MKSYPIWVETQNGTYSSGGHRYGVKDHATATIYVGSSRVNSHEFATFEKVYKQLPCGAREFQLLLDGHVVKKAVVTHGLYEEVFDIWKDVVFNRNAY